MAELREKVGGPRLGERFLGCIDQSQWSERDFHSHLRREDSVDDVHARDDRALRVVAESGDEFVVGNHARHQTFGRELSCRGGEVLGDCLKHLFRRGLVGRRRLRRSR